MGRCYKGRFTDDKAARMGLKRCHGGVIVDGILWRPCRYLEQCLGCSVTRWKEKKRRE